MPAKRLAGYDMATSYSRPLVVLLTMLLVMYLVYHRRLASIRLATVGVTSAVTSSPTQQICLCGNELMRREVVTVT